jgi:hypothetical protein
MLPYSVLLLILYPIRLKFQLGNYPYLPYTYVTYDIKMSSRGRDRMLVGFITTYAISAYHHYRREFEPRSYEAYLIQHYVIKFVSDLRQVGGFLRNHPVKRVERNLTFKIN